MSEPLRVRVTPRGAAQIERAVQWWRLHRAAASEAVLDDFESARALLALQPAVGARCSSPQHAELRRLYLSRIKYHVYYRVDVEQVVVLAIWHASRGSAPRL